MAIPRVNVLLTFLVGCAVLHSLVGCHASCPPRTDSSVLACSDPYLSRLVGSWSIQRSIRGKIVGNRMDVEPVLGGAFVQLHMQSTTPDDPYEAIVLIGSDAEHGEYIAHWCDSFGPGMSAVGRGKRDGERLELRFEYPSGPFFNTWMHSPETDSWTFTGESGTPEGVRRLFARDVVTRRPVQ